MKRSECVRGARVQISCAAERTISLSRAGTKPFKVGTIVSEPQQTSDNKSQYQVQVLWDGEDRPEWKTITRLELASK